jgi:outer membrane protein
MLRPPLVPHALGPCRVRPAPAARVRGGSNPAGRASLHSALPLRWEKPGADFEFLLLVLIGFLLISVPAAAQTRPLSLRDAVALAVRQNPALAAAGAQVATAQAASLAARGLDDLVLSASTGVRAVRREPVPGVPVQQRALDELVGSVSLTQPLPIGGRAGVNLETGYRRTSFATELTPPAPAQATSEHTPSLSLSLEQPLLRGFGVDVARAERRRASIGLDVARAGREGLVATLVRDVIQAYWALVHATRELEIRRSSAAAAREQLARVHANIAVGKLPHSASAEIEVAIAVREDSVLVGQQEVTEWELSLGRLMGVSTREPLAAVDSLPVLDLVGPESHELAATVKAALAHNPQLQALRAQGRAGALELEVTENLLLPQLDVSIAGGPVGNASRTSAAYEQITGFRSYALMANLSLELSLGRHAALGARDAARAGLRQAQLGETDLAAQITMAVAQTVAAIATARSRAAVLTPSMRAAALDLEAEKARFDVGRAENFDVLRRQDALAAVQLLLLQAQVTAVQARASLDAWTGQILEQNGVVVRAGGG